MAMVNKDPHRVTYQFLPKHCVTALFNSKEDAAKGASALRAVGFAESDIQEYIGERGAEQLDVNAEKQSAGTRVLQAVTKALADDGGYLERAAHTLHDGGAMIRVEVGEDEPTATRATNALKSAGGDEVQFWGEWLTEQL